MKKLLSFVLIIAVIFCFAACGDKGSSSSQISENDIPSASETGNKNHLTGEMSLDKDSANKRPLAVMINNIKISLPQRGISKADVLYETLAEGGITRIMMLVSDYANAGTIGSIRSSRDYFVDFLDNHDALYVHAGGSPLAYAKINYREINNLDGVKGYAGNTFWRDPERMQTMAYEHTLMTSGEGIKAAVDMMKYRTELSPTVPASRRAFRFGCSFSESTFSHSKK